VKYYRILNAIVDDKDIITKSDDIEALDKVSDELNRLEDRLLLDDTGAYTKYALKSVIERQKYSIIFIDLDNLKTTNDTKGHVAGDKLLLDTVKLLKDYGNVYRIGGDEFIILTDDNSIRSFISRFRDTKQFSFGIVKREEYTNYSDAIKLADERMYINKNSKKNSRENSL